MTKIHYYEADCRQLTIDEVKSVMGHIDGISMERCYGAFIDDAMVGHFIVKKSAMDANAKIHNKYIKERLLAHTDIQYEVVSAVLNDDVWVAVLNELKNMATFHDGKSIICWADGSNVSIDKRFKRDYLYKFTKNGNVIYVNTEVIRD